MIGIYKITSPTGKIYIGQSVNVNKRFSGYKRLSNIKKQVKLYNSFLKYGAYNHVFEIIDICDIIYLNERERYWQDHYDVTGADGLNCRLTKSNDKSAIISQETRLKMSISAKKKVMTETHMINMAIALRNSNGNKGKPMSKENKQKLSIRNKLIGLFEGKNNPMYDSKRFGNKNPFFNKIHSNGSRAIMSDKATGRKATDRTRSILSKQRSMGLNSSAKIVLNMDTGIFYECGKEAWMTTDKYVYSTFKSKLNGSNKYPTEFRYV